MEGATAAHRPLGMEMLGSAGIYVTRALGSIGSAEAFAEGTGHTATKWDVHCAGPSR
jgi:hypothetical protein